VLTLVFLFGFAAFASDPLQLVYGLPDALVGLLWLPLIIGVLALVVLIFALLAWAHQTWGIWGRIHYTLIALFALAFVWFLSYWNLLTANLA
jgi:hypothetical protein